MNHLGTKLPQMAEYSKRIFFLSQSLPHRLKTGIIPVTRALRLLRTVFLCVNYKIL